MSTFPRKPSAWRRQCFSYDPLLGWWHISNVTALLELGGDTHLFRTNSAGMRSGKEYPAQTPKGRKRIALLGDSYTAGDGVSNGERFSDLLESYHPHLDVLNFGVNGTGTDQQALIYEHKALVYEHDAVLWGICVENIVRNLCTCRPSYSFAEHQVMYRSKPWFSLEEDELVLHNTPVPAEGRTLDALDDWICMFSCMPPGTNPEAIYEEPESYPWRLMERILLRVADLAADKPLYLAPLPMWTHYMEIFPACYMKAFHDLAQKRSNIHVIDVFPSFMRVSPHLRPGLKFATDPHYTAFAHRIVAEALDTAIAAETPELLHLQG